jgi:hypothetical protein
MKKSLLSVVVLIAATFAVMAFTFPSGKGIIPPQDQKTSLFPDNVQKILETSCFDCHSDAASNAKAKMKLNFSKWSELSDAKKVGKMEGINETIQKNDMPPGKYLEKFPEKVLSAEQKGAVSKWVTEESAKLMGQ